MPNDSTTEDHPMPDEFVALLVLLCHLPQLAPELPITGIESSWQEKDNFKEDYKNIFPCVLKYLKSFRRPTILWEQIESCEQRLKSWIEHYEKVNPMGFQVETLLSSLTRDVIRQRRKRK